MEPGAQQRAHGRIARNGQVQTLGSKLALPHFGDQLITNLGEFFYLFILKTKTRKRLLGLAWWCSTDISAALLPIRLPLMHSRRQQVRGPGFLFPRGRPGCNSVCFLLASQGSWTFPSLDRHKRTDSPPRKGSYGDISLASTCPESLLQSHNSQRLRDACWIRGLVQGAALRWLLLPLLPPLGSSAPGITHPAHAGRRTTDSPGATPWLSTQGSPSKRVLISRSFQPRNRRSGRFRDLRKAAQPAQPSGEACPGRLHFPGRQEGSQTRGWHPMETSVGSHEAGAIVQAVPGSSRGPAARPGGSHGLQPLTFCSSVLSSASTLSCSFRRLAW